MVKASIIIPTYNGKRYLYNCLNSVLNQTYRNYEVILVENGGSDNTVEYVKKKFNKYINNKRLKIVVVEKNNGFVGGNNEGVKYIHKNSEYIVLLSNDTKVRINWLEQLLLPMSNKNVGIVGSLVLNKGKEKEIVKYILNNKCTINLCGDTVDIKKNFYDLNFVFPVFYVGGCSLAYKREIVEEPFWNQYFSYSEDIYLCWLTRLKGYNIYLNTLSIVEHSHGGETKNANKEMYNKSTMHGIKNTLLNYFLFYRPYNIVRIFPLLILTQLGHIIYQPEKLKYHFMAYKWLIMNWRKILKQRKMIQKNRVTGDKDLISLMSYKIYNSVLINNNEVSINIMNSIFWLYCKIMFIKTGDI